MKDVEITGSEIRTLTQDGVTIDYLIVTVRNILNDGKESRYAVVISGVSNQIIEESSLKLFAPVEAALACSTATTPA